jgi:hypothetical protein
VTPADADLLAFEPGCEEYCEREVDEVQWLAVLGVTAGRW